MLWVYPQNPSKAAERLRRLEQQPFAGVLPGRFTKKMVIDILKPLHVSHIEMSPIIRAREYGKHVIHSNPNPKGMDFYDPEYRPSRPVHSPRIHDEGNQSILCQHAGNHGISLRATKVTDLSIESSSPGFLMKWLDSTGRQRQLALPPEDD